MGRQVLIILWCCMAIGTNGQENKTVNVPIENNVSAESAPSLYSDASSKVYAYNTPYTAVKFGVLRDPVNAGSRLIPVKEESFVLSSKNGVLKDSYGNKFVETPQMVAYKMTSPQQYVRLQDLPVHLSQPLVAAPSYGFHNVPHGAQPRQISAVPTPIIRYHNPSQAHVYAGNIRNYAPIQAHYTFPAGSPQRQASNSKEVYHNQPKIHYGYPKKFARLVQTLDTKPTVTSSSLPSQSAPAKQVAAPANGKKANVSLATKPLLPLLNLNLLQPLTFANPVVAQVQHFLPKINYKFPEVETQSHHDEYVIQKTKSYDTGIINNEPEEDDGNDKPPSKPSQTLEHDHSSESKPTHDSKPSVTVKGNRGDPEYSYEINSPNYKESYNEMVVNYGNKGEDKPVHYTYSKQFKKKPVSYSVTSSSNSKDPSKNVYIEVHDYNSKEMSDTERLNNDRVPKREKEDHPQNTHSSESGEDYSGESDEETPRHNSHVVENEGHHKHDPRHFSQGSYNESPKHHSNHETYHESPQHHLKTSHDRATKHQSSYKVSHSPKSSHRLKPEHREEQNSGEQKHGVNHHNHAIPHNRQYSHPNKVPAQISSPMSQPISPHFYEEDIIIVPNSPIRVDPNQHTYNTQSHYHQQPEHVHVHQQFNNHAHRQLPQIVHHQSENPQHVPPKPNVQVPEPYASPPPQQDHHESEHFHPAPHQNQQHNHNDHHHHQYHHKDHHHQQPKHYDFSPHIFEKSRKIIIQAESPDEMHSLREQMVEEMMDQEENNEEDFEKAYKDAAIGFPSYERDHEQIEKDIYNPALYGIPRDGYDFENSPFHKYVQENDEFPKSARVGYKNANDNMKEDYFLDYSVSKPESLLDRHKSKVNYYKMYKSQKPSSYFGDEPEQKQKKSESYTADPYVFEYHPYPVHQKQANSFARYKEVPRYAHLNEAPQDSYAYSSGPSRTSKTLFVEPQFQYGFEPISLPTLLDSELSAMASNDSPESDKSGTRKKIYKENWYIKKTSTSASKPAAAS